MMGMGVPDVLLGVDDSRIGGSPIQAIRLLINNIRARNQKTTLSLITIYALLG